MSFRPPMAPMPTKLTQEELRNAEWQALGFAPAINCPHLKGRIITNRNGVQVVETDSREEGKRLIHQLGFCYIPGGDVGDYIELEYRVHMEKNVAMWFGWIVRKGS